MRIKRCMIFATARLARSPGILFFGAAPGYPGYYQVNFRVASGVAAEPVVPVRLTYLSRPSNEGTFAVQ